MQAGTSSTVRYNVGKCPACRFFLWADVDIEVEIGEPTMTTDGKAAVSVRSRIVGMRVAHSCWLDGDGVFEVRETADLGEVTTKDPA